VHKISSFRFNGVGTSGYAAGRLSPGCGAAAFIPAEFVWEAKG
jgi:hypothetical protein